jgi:carboxypeptidase family protein
MMRRLAVTLTLVLSVGACSSGPAATARIEGRVLAGPTCPVETPDASCEPRPWTGRVRATEEDGRTYETSTDADGRYAIAVPPGTYTVVAVTGEGGPPTGIPQVVPIADGASLTVDLEVDTGIR